MTWRNVVGLVVVAIVSGCSFGVSVVVHDEDRAAELTRSILTQTFEGDAHGVYELAHEELRAKLSRESFGEFLSQVRSKIAKGPVAIVGYETYGTQEAIAIYAMSQAEASAPLYMRLTYLGTKSKDYRLGGFRVSDTEFEKKGLYEHFDGVLLVTGV